MPYKTLTCEHCGSEFEGWHNAKYCSDECRYSAHKVERECQQCGGVYEGRKDQDTKYCSEDCFHAATVKRETRECGREGCDKELEVRPSDDQTFCSNECGYQAQRNRVERECLHCGTQFEVPASDGSRKYCSQDCYWEHDTAGPETEERACPHCGDSFEVKASKVTQYCSEGCSAEAKRDRIQKTCEQCGEEFEIPPSMSYRKYCSEECFAESLRLVEGDYQHLRDNVVARGEDVESHIPEYLDAQDGECVYCGTDITDSFHLDHKTPISRGGEHTLENTHLTCPDCNHQKHHRTHAEYVNWRRDNNLHIHHLAIR